MAQTSSNNAEIRQKLESVDEKLRQKYLEVLQSFDLEELKHFNKTRFKTMAIAEFTEQVPNAAKNDIEGYAQCISNYLQSEAKSLKSAKLQTHVRITRKSLQKGRSSNSEKPTTKNANSGRKSHTVITADSQSSPCDTILTESLLENLENTFDSTTNLMSHKTVDQLTNPLDSSSQQINDISDASMTVLDNSIQDPDDTLSSTFSASELDGTYDSLDKSVTELKRAVQTEDKTKLKQKDKHNKTTVKENHVTNHMSSDDDILCIDSCVNDSSSASIRCNLCLIWCHTVCVGIRDLDDVDAWVCADCKALPKTVKGLKEQVETLVQTTSDILKTFETFSKSMEHKFDNINDRLTGLSNQNKSSKEVCTSSLTDINKDITNLRSEMDKKSNAILSKSQCILDQIKTQPDPATNETPGNKKPKHNQTNQKNQKQKSTPINVHEKQNSTPTVIDLDPDSDYESSASNINNLHENTESHASRTQSEDESTSTQNQKRDLTFLTGSCILQYIETRHMKGNVRIKSFKGAKIDDLKHELAKMDLSRYENIVLHVGGHDIDANISQTAFREKYSSLLNSLNFENCKLFVSGILPRRGINVKPFNTILSDLCRLMKTEYVDNHDSFVMASGEIPFDFFFPDKVNLKFSGTRKLVQNINKLCKILPIQHSTRSREPIRYRPQQQDRSGYRKQYPGYNRRFGSRN